MIGKDEPRVCGAALRQHATIAAAAMRSESEVLRVAIRMPCMQLACSQLVHHLNPAVLLYPCTTVSAPVNAQHRGRAAGHESPVLVGTQGVPVHTGNAV